MRSRADGEAVAMTSRDVARGVGASRVVGEALRAIDAETKLAGILESDYEFALDSTSTSTLAVALMAEVLGGPSARWRAYCDALPREVDSLTMWSDDELAALQGSALAARAKERRALVQREYDALFPALAEARPETFGDERMTPELFRWAYATVLARAFALPDLNCMALLPGLDLFNSARDADKCVVELGAKGGVEGATVTLAVGVGGANAGDQLFHDYADHASGGALLEFGFVYHGDYERDIGSYAMDVSLKPALEALDDASRRSLVDRDVFGAFNIRRSLTFEISNVGGVYKPALKGLACVKPEMMRAARALALRPSDAIPGSLDAPLDEAVERRALRLLADTFARERERYSATTIDEDAALLAHVLQNPTDVARCVDIRSDVARAATPPSARFARRFPMALEVRLGEKRLLDSISADLARVVGYH